MANVEDRDAKHDRKDVVDVENNIKKSNDDLTMLMENPPDIKVADSWTVILLITNVCMKTMSRDISCIGLGQGI